LAEAAYKFAEGRSREESLRRTLCCDQTTEIPPQKAPAKYAPAYKALRKQHETTADDGHVDLEAVFRSILPDLLNYTAFSNTVWQHVRGRKLCATTGGYLGSVPSGSLIGDKICILFASVVPFVLRGCKGEFFKLVGECYIHGTMDGEAIKDETSRL